MSPNPSSESPNTISPEQLAEALLRVNLPEFQGLVKRLPGLKASLDTPRSEVAACLAEIGQTRPANLDDLLGRLHERLGGLDRTLVNCVLFMERSAKQWDQISPLDAFVRKAFLQRRHVFAALLLDQPEFVLDDQHPMAQLLTRVEQLFVGWEEKTGQPPAFIMKALTALTRLLDADHCLNADEQQNALEVLTQEWEKERQRRKALEKRLIHTETGLDKARYYQFITARELNRRIAGKLLPDVIVQFLHGHWLDSLRLVLTERGVAGDGYRQMLKITEQLVFAFQPIQSEEDYEKLYNFAVELVDRIAKYLLSLVHAPVDLQQQVDMLESHLMVIIKRTAELERSEAPAVPCDVDIPDGDVVVADIEALVGQWFRRFDKICKILVYLPCQKKVLWGDFAGRKAGLENAEDVLRDHQAGTLESFSDQTRLHGVFQAVGKAFVSMDRLERLRQRDRLLQEKAEREAARLKAQAEAEAIEQARREAEEQARIEREEAEARLREEQLAEEERERLEELGKARAIVDGLKLGDPVTIVKDEKRVSASLAVRLAASRKLIFTDHIGLKVAELQRDDAVQAVLEGRLIPGDEGGQNEAMRARFMGRMGVGKR